MQLKTGSLLQGGKYRVELSLGQGGFGITYLAVHVGLNRKIAIKEFFMKEHCNRDADTSKVGVPSVGSRELVDRFKVKFIKEAQTIATLNHPHIVRIYDIFEENGTAYYVMEYHGMGSLSGLELPLPVDRAVSYIKQISSALSYLHERNIMHLDVKPSNILLDENGCAVLIDFGVSKRYDDTGHQTSSTPVGISHGYAPIEQYSQKTLTFSPTTDIYALGATLYKLVTGETPSDANSLYDEELPKMSADIPLSVQNAIRQSMQPSRKNRPQSIGEFLEMLGDVYPSQIIIDKDDDKDVVVPILDDTTEIAQTSDVLVQVESVTEEQEQKTEPKMPKKKSKVWLWLLLCGTLIGVLLFFLLRTVDLSSDGSANCYIVSDAGEYKFKTVKGNTNESVGAVTSVGVLWESYGTDIEPKVGDLIKSVSYSDGYITFETADTFKKGNAVIAAYDSSHSILWSWHIWLTDPVAEHEYLNNAGVMMDRNLGATSAIPGRVETLGLLYQWGRKDPFLGSASILSNEVAASTITWPSPVPTNYTHGTVSYVTTHPTTYVNAWNDAIPLGDESVYDSSTDWDWHYSYRDDRLWSYHKTQYDPCPPGWKVPNGGKTGVWSTALDSSHNYTNENLFSDSCYGIDFSYEFGYDLTIWYPATGYRSRDAGELQQVGKLGYSWSSANNDSRACYLRFNSDGDISPSYNGGRANGYPIRCVRE